jgi:hypothetical protein
MEVRDEDVQQILKPKNKNKNKNKSEKPKLCG